MSADSEGAVAPRIVAVGELLAEFIPLKVGQRLAEPGPLEKVASGAAGIYACAGARMGAAVTMLAVVGEEAFSRFVLEALVADGVDTSRIRRTDDAQIGLSFVEYVGRNRNFIYYRRDSAGSRLSPDDIPEDLIASADVVHFPGNLLYAGASLRGACLRAAELAGQSPSTLLSVDPNVRLEMVRDPADLERVRDVIGQAQLIKPSREEAELLTGNSDPVAACRELLAMGPTVVAVTLGEDGCILARDGEMIRVGAYEVQCLDPTGAGDAFSAGMAVGLCNDWPLDRIAAFASAAGALTTTAVGHIGRAIPERGEIERLMGTRPKGRG